MGPITGNEMDEGGEKLFQDTVDNMLIAAFAAYDPPIENISSEVTEQIVKQLGRRKRKLLKRQIQEETGFIYLFFDLVATGQFQPKGTVVEPEDIDFDTKLKGFFSSSSNTAILVDSLKESSSPDAAYFSAVQNLQYTNVDPNEIGNQGPGNDDTVNPNQPTDNTILIVAITASACGALLFAVAIFTYSRSRRSRLNQAQIGRNNDAALFLPTSPVDSDPGWAGPQLTQSNESDDDDDAMTDTGRSQKTFNTFNTLEKIYSGEAGDQMSLQSYGYSLDDGVAENRAMTPVSDIGGTLGDMDLYGMRRNYDPESDVDVSLGSPGNSVFSALTNDTSAKNFLRKERNIDEEEGSVEEDPLKHIEFERVCVAPPGKLGVVIDTTKLGPVVYQVKDESPLQGLVFPGDRIIAIDGIDTRKMTASNITKIMARKAGLERKLTVSSKTEIAK